MAGGKINNINSLYYLYNPLRGFWTMSPTSFERGDYTSRIWIVESTGSLEYLTPTSKREIRPVINLNKDVLIKTGDGTQENPYEVILNK